MRRNRVTREASEQVRKQSVISRRRRVAQARAVDKKRAKLLRRDTRFERLHRRQELREQEWKDSVAATESNFSRFQGTESYQYSATRPVIVCHVIASLGMGGAQTMMCELVNGLNAYHSDNIVNHVLYVAPKEHKYDRRLYKSYGCVPNFCTTSALAQYCKDNDVDVVVQHRISTALDLRNAIPSDMKYILINHTVHQMDKMRLFPSCDFYVSVCKFLHKRTDWPKHIHDSRKVVILNGVENDYIEDIEPAELEGNFKTGRCHRMVPSKFRADSLRYLHNKLAKEIRGLRHFIMGHSQQAKSIADRFSTIVYFGSINKRSKKMSIIKALDVYYYETYADEGASMAILESLAAGVPVVCKTYGGCKELIINGVNGYLVTDRSGFHVRLKDLDSNRKKLKQLKESTKIDFEKRLHIRHTVCRYMQLFEHVIKS